MSSACMEESQQRTRAAATVAPHGLSCSRSRHQLSNGHVCLHLLLELDAKRFLPRSAFQDASYVLDDEPLQATTPAQLQDYVAYLLEHKGPNIMSNALSSLVMSPSVLPKLTGTFGSKLFRSC